MKMKEVIRLTGLTDRAVRLYIESGLVEPDCNESHSGRRSIEFSDENVQELNNIALLRKAGFSIADIKLLMIGGEDARQVLEKYKNDTSELIEWKERVLLSLEEIPVDEEVTLECVCEKLSVAVADRKVPAEDNKLTVLQRIEMYSFRTISIIGLVISFVLIASLAVFYKVAYRYTTIDFESIKEMITSGYIGNIILFLLYFLFVIQLIISLILFVIYNKPKFFGWRRWLRVGISMVISCFLIASLFFVPVSLVLTGFYPLVYSETDNPSHYLSVDDYVKPDMGRIYRIFPAVIPYEADKDVGFFEPYPETTKYYYKHSDQEYPQYDIFSEWALSDKLYTYVKEEMLKSPPLEIMGTRDKGDWHCLYFADFEEDNLDYYNFLIFAYNDRLNTVRYISSYCMDTGGGSYSPYYFTLNW